MFKLPKIKTSGFTLIELLVVIVVIVILATIVLFGLNVAQRNARDTQRAAIMRGIQNALQAYFSDQSPQVYPATGWAAAFPGGCAAAGAVGLCPYLTNALKDPLCGAALAVGDNEDVRVDTTPCGTGTNKPVYNYISPAASTRCTGAQYELELTKEAGGTQDYCGPR